MAVNNSEMCVRWKKQSLVNAEENIKTYVKKTI